MSTPRSLPPTGALGLGLCLLALGFAVGRGFHTATPEPTPAPTPTPPVNSAEDPPAPPIAKALRLSPDNRTLAFTGVYDRSRRASRFLLDVPTGKWHAVGSPRGWQDYIMGWDTKGKTLLFDREKIPRSVADTAAGLHTEGVQGLEGSGEKVAFPNGALPRGEKSISGFFAPGGELVVKTRREPKSLFGIGTGGVSLLDTANNFGQNRVVRENGRDVLYVMRELASGDSALFRVDTGKARQLTAPLARLTWSYVAENGAWLVVCREAADGKNWDWTLYRVSPVGTQQLGTQQIPGDASGVFWSPDRKEILGAGGGRLWRISIPSLKVTALGARTDWNADDAAWLNARELIVASGGSLWRVQVPSGAAREIWKFPKLYWKRDG